MLFYTLFAILLSSVAVFANFTTAISSIYYRIFNCKNKKLVMFIQLLCISKIQRRTILTLINIDANHILQEWGNSKPFSGDTDRELSYSNNKVK